MVSEIIALIPARAGSKRLKDKNIKKLNGHPLIAYTINVAKRSKIFKKIFCITDSEKYQKIANFYGSDKIDLRPKKLSLDGSPDIEWLKWAINKLQYNNISFKYFAILRPTNPFRTTTMIKNAYKIILKNKKADSIRAVELTKIHPGKIWIKKKNYIFPLIKKNIKGVPWHSMQYAGLPKFYSQNASLEISSLRSFKKYKSISGKKIIPYITKNFEGFDINTSLDFEMAKILQKSTKKFKIKRS